MKLMIDIPEWYYKEVKEFKHPVLIDKSIMNGTPLDDVRAEILQLDDVEYDFEGYYKAVTDALKIIDNIGKAESEE